MLHRRQGDRKLPRNHTSGGHSRAMNDAADDAPIVHPIHTADSRRRGERRADSATRRQALIGQLEKRRI